MSSHINSIILRYKNKTKKLGFKSKLSPEDLSYLIANHFDIKGKILGLKDASDNFNKIQTFCTSNLLKTNEVYHVIVDSSEIPPITQQSVQKPAASTIRNSSIHQHSEPAQKHLSQSETRFLNSQSHHKQQISQHHFTIPNQHVQLGLSSMITIVNNFKVWEDNFQDPQEDRTSVIALVEDKESILLQDPIANNSLVNQYNSEWVNVMNSLVDNYGDRVDYFCCNVKNREEIHYLKVFPSVIVYKGGQKVMEISLQNQTKTILRLLERFLNTASGMLGNSGQLASSHFPLGQPPQALLLMEQSVQQTELDTGDIITIPANIPDQRELLNLLDMFVSNNQISTLDFYIFKCRILEKFDLFMRGFFEVYSDFDQNSFKDYLQQIANQQNTQDKLDVDSNNLFENRNYSNNRPQSSAQPTNSGARRTPSRQQTSNFGSDSKLGFSQEQLMKAVIELETSNLLEMPILTQIKKLILAENQEIITIIEGYLSNAYNKSSLSEKLKKVIIQTNHFDRPTSPWPKKEKIIQMFQNIVSKNLLTDKEVEVLQILIEKNNQLLMGTFSDGRLQDELVKSLKRIASQYLKSSEVNASQPKQRSTNQSGDLKQIKNFDNIKVNNFFQQQPLQSQFQQVIDIHDENSQQQEFKKEYLSKKLDFQSGEHQSQDEIQFSNIGDQILNIQGSDHKQKRIQQYNNAHQSSTSSAQFANIQRQILSASPVVDHQQNQVIETQPHFRGGEDNEDSPLHTIQLHQQLNQVSGGPKPTNLYNIISANNNEFAYNQTEQLQKKLDQITNSQQQSNDDLQIFNSNTGLSNKESIPIQQNQREVQSIGSNIQQQMRGLKSEEGNKLENTDSEEDFQADQQNKQMEEEQQDEDNEDPQNAVNTYLEFMDDHIDQFNPEDYGMAIHLLNQQNEDIIQLFEEIIEHNQLSNVIYSIMPIKIMVSSKLKEALSKNFKIDEISFIEQNKSVVTTSIFAVHQAFRVQCDLDQFIINLRQAVQRDQTRKLSMDESDEDSNSNRQVVGYFKSYQDKIHPDEILQESNAISPIDQSLANHQHYIQDNQPSFSNQPNYYQQAAYNDSVSKPTQTSAEFSYRPQDARQEPQQFMEQERISNSAAKKQGLISLHNAQSETEIPINRPPITNESSDSSIRKRLRTESLQVETNAKFSPRNKKPQRSNSPDKLESGSLQQLQEEKDKTQKSPTQQSQFKLIPTQAQQQQSHYGLINLKKLQQIDVNVQSTGMNVQDNDLNEILSHEINEFYCSYIYNENDRLYDEIVNLSSTTTNPLSKKVLEVFSILYQVNDLEVIDVIEEYKEQRNLTYIKEKLINITGYKRKSSYSTIQTVNNRIGKFNLFKRLLRIIENQYRSEKVDFQVQQYLFLHDDVVTLAAFEAYCVNKNWREFVENLVLIGKMSLIKFNLNQTEISKLNQFVLDQLQTIYAYGRYLRSEEKKDLEIVIKQEQGESFIQKLVNQYDADEINERQLIDGICQYVKDVSSNLRKEEYFLKQKYSCPSIEEREELKKTVEQYRAELADREITNMEIFNQLIYSANKNLLGALCLFDYMKDSEDFLENLAMIYHYETSNDMKRIIKEFSRSAKWDQNQVKFLIQKVDDDEPLLMGAYYRYKKNETDKDEKLELRETFELYLLNQYNHTHNQ